MTNNTQQKFVETQLELHGIITRNTCLRNYISRLGAIIHTMKRQGWVFSTYWNITEHGKDFVYKLEYKPDTK